MLKNMVELLNYPVYWNYLIEALKNLTAFQHLDLDEKILENKNRISVILEHDHI